MGQPRHDTTFTNHVRAQKVSFTSVAPESLRRGLGTLTPSHQQNLRLRQSSHFSRVLPWTCARNCLCPLSTPPSPRSSPGARSSPQDGCWPSPPPTPPTNEAAGRFRPPPRPLHSSRDPPSRWAVPLFTQVAQLNTRVWSWKWTFLLKENHWGVAGGANLTVWQCSMGCDSRRIWHEVWVGVGHVSGGSHEEKC